MRKGKATRSVNFRLGREVEGLLEALGRRLGGLDRSAVVRLAVRRLADAEGLPRPPEVNPRPGRPKNRPKSSNGKD